jgi:hypothetical protein
MGLPAGTAGGRNPWAHHNLTRAVHANARPFNSSGVAVSEEDLAPMLHFGQHFASYIMCVLLWLAATGAVSAAGAMRCKARSRAVYCCTHTRLAK